MAVEPPRPSWVSFEWSQRRPPPAAKPGHRPYRTTEKTQLSKVVPAVVSQN